MRAIISGFPSPVVTLLTSWHCEFRPTTEGAMPLLYTYTRMYPS
jgi:hypothetical protein